jgi:ribosome-binding factor A
VAAELDDAPRWEERADELFGARASSRRRSAAHKDEQLCAQVFQILTYAMADLADERLRGATVVAVAMAPDGRRLLVTVVSDDARPASVDELREQLQRSQGRLRAEIASGIHRKRTPELGFRVVTREEVER